MSVNPAQPLGVSGPQGLSNTQLNAPPAVPPQGMPMDPAMMDPMAMMQPPAQEAPPKPPSLVPTEVAKLLAEAINHTKMEAAKGLVEYLGDPRGSVSVRNVDLLKVWRKRNPKIDPLYEKIINGLSDDEIMEMMYPARRALIRYGRRTYTEQVEFAEFMAQLDRDPRYASLEGENEEDEDEEDDYVPPQSRFPSVGEERYREELEQEREEAEEDERVPEEDEEVY